MFNWVGEAYLTGAGWPLTVTEAPPSESGRGFSPSSGSLTISVSIPTASSAVVPSLVPNPVYQQDTDADGTRSAVLRRESGSILTETRLEFKN
jgi:hypothetical protein